MKNVNFSDFIRHLLTHGKVSDTIKLRKILGGSDEKVRKARNRDKRR